MSRRLSRLTVGLSRLGRAARRAHPSHGQRPRAARDAHERETMFPVPRTTHTGTNTLRTQCRWRILSLSSVTEEPVALRLDFLVALADLVLEASVDEQQVIPRFVLELPGLVAQEQLALHLFKDEAD